MRLLPGLLLGLAVLVAVAAPGSLRRLDVLASRSPALRAPRGLDPRLVRATCLLAGVSAWALVGGVTGAVVGVGISVLGPRALARLDAGDHQDELMAGDLALALDLLAGCLAGGAATVDALRAVSAALPGPCGSRLGRVAAALVVGSSPQEAWRVLGEDRGPAGAAARALARAADGGAPVASAVRRVAADTRLEAGGRAERAARRAGVLAVAPLGLCFLPAFVLLGVVPVVIGLAGPLLRSL